MAGFGVLLWARRRLRGAEAPLSPVSPEAAHKAARALLIVVAVLTTLVVGIVGFRVRSGLGMSFLSVLLPGIGLAWLGTLALQMQHHREPRAAASSDEGPSRLPPNWETLPNRKSSNPSAPDRQVNA